MLEEHVDELLDAAVERNLSIDVADVARLVNCQASAALPEERDHSSSASRARGLLLQIVGGMDHDTVAALSYQLDLDQSDREVLLHLAVKPSLPSLPLAIRGQTLCYMANRTVATPEKVDRFVVLTKGAVAHATLDLIWAEPWPLRRDDDGRVHCPSNSTLLVGEYQAELSETRSPAGFNPPLLAKMVLAARWTGAKSAQPVVVLLEPGKHTFERGVVRDVHSLGVLEVQLRSLAAKVERQRQLAALGEQLDFRQTQHCQSCPGQRYCPAYVELAKALLDVAWDPAPTELTPDQARDLAIKVTMSQSVMTEIRGVLRSYCAKHGDIDLGRGQLWGKCTRQRLVFVPSVAHEVLAGMVDGDPNDATTMSSTEVRRLLSRARRSGIAPTVGAAFGIFLERAGRKGGVVHDMYSFYGRKYAQGKAGDGGEVPAGEPEEPRGAEEPAAPGAEAGVVVGVGATEAEEAGPARKGRPHRRGKR